MRPWDPQTDREAGREGAAPPETLHPRSETSTWIGGGQRAMSKKRDVLNPALGTYRCSGTFHQNILRPSGLEPRGPGRDAPQMGTSPSPK